MNTIFGSAMRVVLLGGLLLLGGCCAESDSNLSVVGDGDDPPQESAVAGAVVFVGGGGVQIDLSVIDPEEPGAATSGEITAWAGSRDSNGSTPLPSPSNPPTSTPIEQTAFWNFRRMNGTDNPWTPGVIDRTYNSAHDQYWVYVRLTMQRQGGGTPIVLSYRHEWDIPADGSMVMEDFLKL